MSDHHGTDAEAASPIAVPPAAERTAEICWCLTCPRLRLRADVTLDLGPGGRPHLVSCSLRDHLADAATCKADCVHDILGDPSTTRDLESVQGTRAEDEAGDPD